MVITSSIVATDTYAGGDEATWNESDVQTVRANGANAKGKLKYNASKVLSEQAAWKFVKDNTREVNFDVITLLPTWVWGVSLLFPYDSPSLTRRSDSP